MPNFLVTLLFDPGVPQLYVVENVADHRAARAHVRNILGYDPGVLVEVTQAPINDNNPVRYSNLGGSND